jgi:hypothetical protein
MVGTMPLMNGRIPPSFYKETTTTTTTTNKAQKTSQLFVAPGTMDHCIFFF